MHTDTTAGPGRLDRVNPSVSPQLSEIVARCRARNPDERYADMAALIEALDHPENVDVSILDKLKTSRVSPPPSLAQMQTVKGIMTAVGIMAALVVLAFLLQQIHR